MHAHIFFMTALHIIMSLMIVVYIAGYTIATGMDAQLLVTLPETISNISSLDVTPKGALYIGPAYQARCTNTVLYDQEIWALILQRLQTPISFNSAL